ncbi:centromere protein C [Acomys russatus]|uniref:centromere protein C n=1 Tax=Acomys russatus TaxID=60746 RepID=UPI0021E1C2E7|nr:centromere protein C [Acomys russatus]
MAFHLDHLKNYHRRFCRPSRASTIHKKQGQNMLEILQDCFEEQSKASLLDDSTETFLHSTPKEKDNCSQSTGRERQASHSKSVPVSSRRKEASRQVSAEPSGAPGGSVQANEVHPKILATDVISKGTPVSNKVSNEETSGHHSAPEHAFYLSVGSPVVLLDAEASVLQNTVSSVGQKRVASVLRNSVEIQTSNTDISLKTRKRLNFEDKVTLGKADKGTKVLEVEDHISGQEGTSSETSQKRGDDMTYEIQPQSKKSFSELFSETVKKKTKSSLIVRHTAAIPPLSSLANDVKLLEDEFIIDESERSFASHPWVTIPSKGRHLRNHGPSPENIATLQNKKSKEKPRSVSAKTLINDTQSPKTPSIEKSQLSVEENLRTSCTNELENDCRSTESKMHSENAKNPSQTQRTMKQKQKRVAKCKVVEEQLNMGQDTNESTNMSNIGKDKLQINSKRSMEDCDEVTNEPVRKKRVPAAENKKKKNSTQKDREKSGKKCFSNKSKNKIVPEEVTLPARRSGRISQHPPDWWVVKPETGSVDRNSSKENESSVVYHNRKKRDEKNHLSKNVGKKSVPPKRRKTGSSSRVQKSLNVKGSGRRVSGRNGISSSQSEPLESNKAKPTQKSLDVSGPTRGSKYQNSVMISQNAQLKFRTGKYTRKTQMESNLDLRDPKSSILEESGPSRLQNYVTSRSNNSEKDDKNDRENLDLRIRSSNMSPDRNIHHKLVLPSNSPNVRRTKRIRLKPLEYWRGERIDYQEGSSGGFVIEIVSPAPVLPKIKEKRNLSKVNKKASRKCIRPDNQKKKKLVVDLDIPLGDPFQATLAKDPETREIVPMDLIRPRDTYQFFVEQHGLKVFKTLDTTVFSTGKLVLGPHEEKGKQHVGQDILVFYVNFGDLLCTLHETPYMISTGDSFYIPSGNHYNIKNLLNVESSLLFTQIKR